MAADPPTTPPTRHSIMPPVHVKVDMRGAGPLGLPTIHTPRFTPTIEQFEQKIPSVLGPLPACARSPSAQKFVRTFVRWALQHMPRSSMPAPRIAFQLPPHASPEMNT